MNRATTETIREALSRRILILDGAMGTCLMEAQLTEEDYRGEAFRSHPRPLLGNTDVLTLTRPDLVVSIHRAYLEAGADIITTNTFNANRLSQKDYGLEESCLEMNRKAAALASTAVKDWAALGGRTCLVAGSVGPTGKTLSISPRPEDPAYREVTFREVLDAYSEQISGLLEGGVDLLLVETVFDTLVARAALVAADRVMTEMGMDLPVVVSATLSDKSGRTFSGQTLEAFVSSVDGPRTFAVGLNCSLGAQELMDHVRRLSACSPYPVSFHPNAGLPDELGDYGETPETTARLIVELAHEGCLNIAGGCCGTSPAHIRAIADALAGLAPRPQPEPGRRTVLCGLESLYVHSGTGILPVGEGTNVSGSRRFARLIREKDLASALAVARKQLDAGAAMLDLCLDDGLLDSRQEMGGFLRRMAGEPDLCRTPLMLDSSDFATLEEGLGSIQGKHAVNSLSLKDGEDIFLKRASILRSYGAAVVVMAFDERGQAETYGRKIEIARRAYDILTTKAGFPPEDIILDLNVLALGTGMEEHRDVAADFLRAVAWVKENLPGAKTSGGISNLSFSFRGHDAIRAALHWVFLREAQIAGLDMAIVNPAALIHGKSPEPELLELALDLVLNRREDALPRILRYGENRRDGEGDGIAEAGEQDRQAPAWRSLPVEKRLAYALEKGVTDWLEGDISEAAEGMTPLEILEGPLLSAMGRVGDAFGEGTMFLPQVVQSARVMKEAFALLAPRMESGGLATDSRKTILLATVRGDVHDIGKNIVGVVLSCNHFRVVDMGVMAGPEEILDRIRKERPDLVGLSGLITPSLGEMCKVAEAMEKEGLDIPLMVGGATTSDLHTALKIAPLYQGGVLRVADASRCAKAARELTGQGAGAFLAGTKARYEALRETRRREQQEKRYDTLEEARARRFVPKDGYPPVLAERGIRQYPEIPLDEILPLVHWPSYLAACHLPARALDEKSDPPIREQARKVMDLAEDWIREQRRRGKLRVRGAIGIFDVFSQGDDLVFLPVHSGTVAEVRLPLIRSVERSTPEAPSFCLADYVSPEREGGDKAGIFAVSVEGETEDLAGRLVSHRLAEAAAQWLQEQVARELPEDRRNFIRPAAGYPGLPDHSLKRNLLDLLGGGEKVGIRLTSSYMMVPEASVLGMYFFHPEARYARPSRMSGEVVEDYRIRAGLSREEALKLLGAFMD